MMTLDEMALAGEARYGRVPEARLRSFFDRNVVSRLDAVDPRARHRVRWGNRVLCSGDRDVLWQKFKIAVAGLRVGAAQLAQEQLT